jgi:hypothetical protein
VTARTDRRNERKPLSVSRSSPDGQGHEEHVVAGKAPTAGVVGGIGFLLGLGVVLRLLIPGHMDPTMFLAVGEDKPIQKHYAERLLGSVDTRPGAGHDGKFFFAQANDPWYLDPGEHAAVLDRPLYRAERMLYPMIAGGFGTFPPGVVVWTLLITNVLALGLGTSLAARLAGAWGLSPWLGLAVPLNIGLLFEVAIDGSGALAYAFCLAGLLALVRGRTWLASLAFAAAALSREVMLAFAVGLVILWLLDRRRAPWRIVIVPAVALATWAVYLGFRLHGVGGTGGAPGVLALPFVGMFGALRSWIEQPDGLAALSLLLVVIVVAVAVLAPRSRLPIAWGALPFVALAVVLSVDVWREPFDLSRALAPVFTAAPFLVALSRHGTVRAHVPDAEET